MKLIFFLLLNILICSSIGAQEFRKINPNHPEKVTTITSRQHTNNWLYLCLDWSIYIKERAEHQKLQRVLRHRDYFNVRNIDDLFIAMDKLDYDFLFTQINGQIFTLENTEISLLKHIIDDLNVARLVWVKKTLK